MRLAGIAVALAAMGELASCGCKNDVGAIVVFTGTDTLTPAEGIWAVDPRAAHGASAPSVARERPGYWLGGPIGDR